jgi:hypothetical protein
VPRRTNIEELRPPPPSEGCHTLNVNTCGLYGGVELQAGIGRKPASTRASKFKLEIMNATATSNCERPGLAKLKASSI